MRKNAIVIGLLLVLLVPIVTIAQDDIVEIFVSDGGATVGITDTLTSVASVAVELNGKQYLLKVPITVAIDATMPLASSIMAVESVSRVGSYAIEIQQIDESLDRVRLTVPDIFGGTSEKLYEPSVEGNKVIAILFQVTNLDTEERNISYDTIGGVDDIGRLFDKEALHCMKLNPGDTGNCGIIFDVDQNVNIVALDFEVEDHRQIPLPR